MKSFFETHRILFLCVGLLAVLDGFLWQIILFSPQVHSGELGLYFLDVGQGDSQLIIFPNKSGPSVKLLIDGGPDASVLRELGEVLGPADRRIDLLMMTHPELDHLGGLVDVIQNYDVGLFLGTGRKAETGAYRGLQAVLREKNVPYFLLGEGDVIRYGDATFDVLSPSKSELVDGELNTTSIVGMLRAGDLRALYTGDIATNVETRLARDYDLRAQVFKVPHHGSRFSSSETFLAEINPTIAVIEVGGKNRYGHPTKEVLDRISSTGAKVFRTDQWGAISVVVSGANMKISVKKKYGK